MTICPTCGQPLPGDNTLEILRAVCHERNLPLFPAERCREDVAAILIGRSVGTLRNWRSLSNELGGEVGPKFYRSGMGRGRVYYSLQTIADFLDESGDNFT